MIQRLLTYFLPHGGDEDFEFREMTIRRVATVILILICVAFPATALFGDVGWPLISFRTIYVCAAVLLLLVLLAVRQRRTLLAAYLFSLTWILIPCGIALVEGYGSLTVGPAFMIALLVSALAVPRSALWLVGGLGFILLCIASFESGLLIGEAGAPYTVSQFLITFFFVSVTEMLILSSIQAEFARRFTALRQAKEREMTAERKARESAEESNRLKSQFVANTSHELRTPLNAIIGYCELMLGGLLGSFTPRQQEIHTNIHASAQRQLALINDMLDLAKIEAGQIQMRLESASPREIIDNNIATLATLAEKKGIYLRTETTDGVPQTVICDKDRVGQILINLIGNAIKFTDQGGVTVRLDPPVQGNQWRFHIQDTGIGMPADAPKYIFEKFRQVDGTETRKHQGTGLGLAITQELVEMMHGTISVQTKLGEGTTFTVTLPCAPVVNQQVIIEPDRVENRHNQWA